MREIEEKGAREEAARREQEAREEQERKDNLFDIFERELEESRFAEGYSSYYEGYNTD